MQKMVRFLKRNYRKCRRRIEIKCGISKADSMEGVEIIRTPDRPVIWLLGTEDFGNLGDHKIAIAIRHFLEKYFSDYDVIEVSARNYFKHCEEIEQNLQKEDIIMGTGGGNFGNQYPESQKIRRDFVTRFRKNKIIIMPQTVWYTAGEDGDKELTEDVSLFAEHERLLIVTREEKSYEFVQKHFKNKVCLAPDMVLNEEAYRSQKGTWMPDKVVVCLRGDLEGILGAGEHTRIENMLKRNFKVLRKIDTQKKYLISTGKRDAEMQEILEEMATASLVVTDRLHGMVFSAIAQTPCIVFDNYNGKVKGIYSWMKDLPYVRYKGTDTDIESDVIELSAVKGSCKFLLPEIEKQFELLAKEIRSL